MVAVCIGFSICDEAIVLWAGRRIQSSCTGAAPIRYTTAYSAVHNSRCARAFTFKCRFAEGPGCRTHCRAAIAFSHAVEGCCTSVPCTQLYLCMAGIDPTYIGTMDAAVYKAAVRICRIRRTRW